MHSKWKNSLLEAVALASVVTASVKAWQVWIDHNSFTFLNNFRGVWLYWLLLVCLLFTVMTLRREKPKAEL